MAFTYRRKVDQKEDPEQILYNTQVDKMKFNMHIPIHKPRQLLNKASLDKQSLGRYTTNQKVF